LNGDVGNASYINM